MSPFASRLALLVVAAASVAVGTVAVTLGAAGQPPSADPAAGPPDRADPVAFTPPASYTQLWREVEECSGLAADLARVRWSRVPSFPDRPRRLAQWEPGHSITVRDDIVIALPIVAHEMLHDLLGGDREHEDPAWRRCALPVAGAGAASGSD